ncbi:chromosome segregation protein SMC [Thermosynechococcus sp. JY1334]|uniref:chromosome segregation protein SMC n=1 Tax=unclassified Thermosynechococcus TaxID=2622553 RepID=UPI0026740BE2|nr:MULTISPECIES: chromosome segregation protein SMC [unclassified Thermosynechococcus]MDR7898490.1 chromosome segregation protein SMC [Thermosynechococcus sp. JY1332]MDR7905892.1 chromosome segregation protein SMC [Thermosynechococcus sp. JY1334]WKT85627.1 chromosome segregation protein SMC [Thermosynechococcus sp. JY1339]WNC56550.1 chromosome segregation protein SMC [Thermosynechococcus sp. JY1331]
MYIKQLELTNFKSFGGTTVIPLLPGFTVISGPNGSGKSNLLDALLFALGLAGSKGMRAERLPDLVNHSQTRRGQSVVETRVTVTFALDAETEWRVTRRLRVTKQGTYTSTYAVNDQPCTLNELHDQLQAFCIYPQGYNVVLQGDVTSIISMNAKARREIIDELAGVADFDRKIAQAREKLDTVKEREERFRIVEQELIQQRDRLQRDRLQAEKYQALRLELQEREQWLLVRQWQAHKAQKVQLQTQIQTLQKEQAQRQEQLQQKAREMAAATVTLEQLNQQVKALGEETYLRLQAALADLHAQQRQCQRQQTAYQQQQVQLAEQLQQRQAQYHSQRLQQQQLTQELEQQQGDRPPLVTAVATSQATLDALRQQAQELNTAAQAWFQEHSQRRQRIDALIHELEPSRSELSRLQERSQQLRERQGELHQAATSLEAQQLELQDALTKAAAAVQQEEQQLQNLAQQLATAQQQLSLTEETYQRLEREQRQKQRELDQLEARQQAVQESQGSFAARLILSADLPGVFGLVAQLGQVEPRYQLALEIAAGARLGNIVVADDSVAAAAIAILKRERAGRATFLPLNKMARPKTLPLISLAGCIDYALNLVTFEPQYAPIFAYVFGSTLVFESLEAARPYLGQYRMVTLEGDLLEPSGAMTGGSYNRTNTLRFGQGATPQESAEVQQVRDRLGELERLLDRLIQERTQKQGRVNELSQALSDARQSHRDRQRQWEQLQQQQQHLNRQQADLARQQQHLSQELTAAETELAHLEARLPELEAELAAERLTLNALEANPSHQQWQQLQEQIQAQEKIHADHVAALQAVDQVLGDRHRQLEQLARDLKQTEQEIQRLRQAQQETLYQQQALDQTLGDLATQIQSTQTALRELDARLSHLKGDRDRQDYQLRQQQKDYQQLEWQYQKASDTLTTLQAQLQEFSTIEAPPLPQPWPEVPANLSLSDIQQQCQALEKRLRAMEPVNMLAIQEFEETQGRLNELQEKLAVLEAERTEILLRIENFTTLRHQSFREAFDAVNANFQTIFATLSDGDGYLQLESPEDPFAGGLNLVAHPKGKPVQRLASMSGGEKSLTALSFIFALQRYRPSPFYAFDEVDMFLDGANVERLAKMIQQQSQEAQFIVVSLRRPMIEAAQRTIGVTQARGQHTQVIGLDLTAHH